MGHSTDPSALAGVAGITCRPLEPRVTSDRIRRSYVVECSLELNETERAAFPDLRVVLPAHRGSVVPLGVRWVRRGYGRCGGGPWLDLL